MRILIPLAAPADTFAENVADTLIHMGHEVRTLGPGSSRELERWRFRWGRVRARYGMSPSRERAAVKAARDFRPEVVLSTTTPFRADTLAEFGRLGAKRVLWWGDPIANSGHTGVLERGWDAVFLKEKFAATELCLAGVNAHHLHEAMNPRRHKQLAKQQNHSVVVAGAFYPFRQAITLRLMENNIEVNLYGQTPPRWADARIRSAHSGRYLVAENKSRVFGEALGCLNTFPLYEPNSLNCRAFEVAGAGGLQFIHDRPAIADCFEPGKELLAFSSFEQLLEHIERARREPEAMQRMRDAAAQRALREHTYEHRLAKLLSIVGQS
jgi:spore maturation protein CgeB